MLIYLSNKLDTGSFQNDMTYEDFKDLTISIASDKMLHDKPFNFAKQNKKKHEGYQRGLA